MFAQVFSVATLAVILTKTTPILLAAIGGAFSQMGNVLNIGLEGMMLMSAFSAVAVGAITNPFVGIVGGIGAAVMLALIFSAATLIFKADYIVVGIGVNLLAAGATILLLSLFYNSSGVTPGNVKAILPKIDLGVVGKVPIIGAAINDQTILVWLGFLLVPVYAFVLYRTRFGVHLRAVGEDEPAAIAAGIRAVRVKCVAILMSGVFCGIAGSQLAMASVGSFTGGMTASRGFIAVAALTFGLGRPYRTMVACLIFGAADAVADQLSLGGLNSSLALTTPYVITVVALVCAALRVHATLKSKTRKVLQHAYV